jgi:hypothetical protein
VKRPRRLAGPRRLLLLVIAVAIAAVAAGITSAAFTASQSSPGNSFNAAADWTAPTASPTTIQKTQGGAENYVKQGGTYHVYAQVTDNGNPPAGVATNGVTANVSSINAGQSAVPLVTTGGPWTVNGTSYNRRTSTQLTADNPLAAGSKNWTVASADTNTPVNSGTSGAFSTTVDNTVPSATDIQTTNSGTAGRPTTGDTVIFTFSEQIDSHSISAGWTGAAALNVVVRLDNGTAAGGNDALRVYNSTNATQLPLTNTIGLNLGRTDYTGNNRTFGLTGTASTMTISGSVVTVTLGTQSGNATTAAGTGTMIWTPINTAYDRAANAMSTTARNETNGGTADTDF